MSLDMSPQTQNRNGIEAHLQAALDGAENEQTRYHIRQALQLTELNH